MKKSFKLLSLLVLPLILASCSEGGAVINEAEIHEWIESDIEVFDKLNALENENKITIPYDKDIFISYEIRTPDEQGGEDTITYESNYDLFYSNDVNKVILNREIESVDLVDDYFNTVKASEGWIVDEAKTNVSEHDYYAYHKIDFIGDRLDSDDISNRLVLNAYHKNNNLCVVSYVETIMSFDAWPSYAIEESFAIDTDLMDSFLPFNGEIEEIKFQKIRLGGLDYIKLDISSFDENALTNYRNEIKKTYLEEPYHDFAKSKDNYYINHTYETKYEGSKYRVDNSLNIYLDKDTTAQSQKRFEALLNLDQTMSYL